MYIQGSKISALEEKTVCKQFALKHLFRKYFKIVSFWWISAFTARLAI
jgi:hypothetical protein